MTRPSCANLVVLDRIEPGWAPPYCTHGRATCIGGCGEWVWLGDKTYEVVASGRAEPICRQCADRLIPPGKRPTRRAETPLLPN